jgi:hypothetical protein
MRAGIPETLMEIPETLICPGAVMVFVVVVGVGAAMTGVTGTVVGVAMPGPAMLTNGDTFGAGNVAQELTPRLAISQEPSGSPVLGLPPGVVGVVDMGVDGDVAGLPDPELHIPDTPTVPIAKVVDTPETGNMPGSVDVIDVAGIPAICALPDVAVVADPIAIPPPS